MPGRKPLTEVQNECSARRKVQRTYGRKGKASAALESAREIFTMADDVERKMANMKLDDSKTIETTGTQNSSGCRLKGLSKGDSVQDSKEHAAETKNAPRLQEPSGHGTSIKAPRHNSTEKKPPIPFPQPERKGPERGSRMSDVLPIDEMPAYDVRPKATSERWEHVIDRFASENSEHPILSFLHYGCKIAKHYDVVKVGEGSYSSVFALTPKKEASAAQSHHMATDPNALYRTTIIKLMPILLPDHGDREDMTEPYFIANETQTMRLMDPIHGFIRYRGLTVTRGLWHKSFLDAFRTFAKSYKSKAENEDPETAFDASQHYALIEMEDAGIEINDIKRPSDFQIYDIFWMTATHLANAETMRSFEHRDLHVSNICVKPDNPLEDRIDVDEHTAGTITKPPKHLLGMSNINVTLIDYTFSRATLATPEEDPTDSIYRHAHKITNFREFYIQGNEYDQLLKNNFISGENTEQEPQHHNNHTSSSTAKNQPKPKFEERMQTYTYAKVASIVDQNYQTLLSNKQTYDARHSKVIAPWEASVPKTNVCWLGYLAACLLQRAGKIARTKYVKNSNDVAKALQNKMRSDMVQVKELLCHDDIEMLPGSANAVVGLGVERGWLVQEDIQAFRERLERESD